MKTYNILYNSGLWQKEIECFLLESLQLAALTISGNCFVNSL